MTEVADLSPTDASNTAITGQSLDGNVANMGSMDDTLQAILGMLGRWTSSDTIASAGTTDIGAQAETSLAVSGTTTITAFGTVRAGTIRVLKFTGILTLTYNATTLILPGAANITTAAGDIAIFVSEGSGNWRCLHYQRVISPPPVTTPWVAYTPTFTSFGTVATISMWSRRVGDTLHVRGFFTTGTCVGNQARMSIGFNGTDGNVTADATKVAGTQGAGTVTQGATSGTTIIPLINGTLAYIQFGGQSTGAVGLTPVNANSVFTDATKYSVMAEIPITGW